VRGRGGVREVTGTEDRGQLPGEADPLGERDEEREAAPGRHRLVRERDPDCLLPIQGVSSACIVLSLLG